LRVGACGCPVATATTPGNNGRHASLPACLHASQTYLHACIPSYFTSPPSVSSPPADPPPSPLFFHRLLTSFSAPHSPLSLHSISRPASPTPASPHPVPKYPFPPCFPIPPPSSPERHPCPCSATDSHVCHLLTAGCVLMLLPPPPHACIAVGLNPCSLHLQASMKSLQAELERTREALEDATVRHVPTWSLPTRPCHAVPRPATHLSVTNLVIAHVLLHRSGTE